MKTIFGKIFACVLCLSLFASLVGALEQESEHPPLSETTKQAIAHYKRNPNDQTKAALRDALTQSYDKVIARKEQNLKTHEAQRQEHIAQWLRLASAGKSPPFLQREGNAKNTKAVQNALSAYQSSHSARDKATLQEALNGYYDAFLDEQRAHITETKNLKQERIDKALAHFSDPHFKPSHSAREASINEEEALIDIIRMYILRGAEFVPVDPAARVREREFNARIESAKQSYEAAPTNANKQKLTNEVKAALQAALNARIQAVKKAEQRGIEGAQKLYMKLKDEDFLRAQIKELGAARNLYGRIDRLVSLGAQDYTPSNAQDSKALFAILRHPHSKAESQAPFDECYRALLTQTASELKARERELDSLARRIVQGLVE